MSDDLEAFLRRAALKRKANQDARRQQQQRERRPVRRPEYSDARNERQVRSTDRRSDAPAAKPDRNEDVPVIAEVSESVEPKMRNRVPSASSPIAADASSDLSTDAFVEELVEALQTPAGLRQAIFLREIMERPQHRWES